jgi:formylglycine-generating enzyme required for sulfatase activity
MGSPPEIGTAKDPISELMKLLAEDRSFTSVEIAETLWLALRIEPAAKVVPERLTVSEEETKGLDSITIENSDRENSDSEDLNTAPPPPPPSPKVNITTPTPKAGVLPPQLLPVWLADPAMLTDPLAIIRALKPLLKQVEAGTGRQLDEAATVDHIARTRLWLPILSPEREPWFDIILVVDRGSSMHIWQRLVNDLVSILRRYGAFRDLQVFNLEVDRETPKPEDKVLLRSHPDRPGHRPSELIDKRGRRIAIVLSDCAGEYWWNGTLLPMLQDWGKVMPTVVWQMLPEWMWERTSLGRGTPVALSNDIPGAANQQLKWRLLERDVPEDADQRLPVPVVTSEVRDLTNWSLMLAGDRREVTPGFLLPKQGGSVPKAKAIEDIARDRIERNSSVDSNGDIEAAVVGEIESIARQRVHRFRQLSSPQGRRLAMLLAAAPVITLPIMRLIRDSMLYEAKSPLPVAEVFLSGLLQRLPGQEDIEPDLVQYEFVAKVRDVLLEVLPAVDTIEVINSVSAAVEKRWNQFSDQSFRAFLMNPNIEAPEGLEGLRSFAQIASQVLRRLGGEYAAFAEQLEGKTQVDPKPSDILQLPPLSTFEFEVATITIEAKIDVSSAPNLQPFEFKVASIEVNQTAQIGTKNPLEIINEAVFEKTGEHLSDIQQSVVKGALANQTYRKIATLASYSEKHLHSDVASKLWKLLSQALGRKVTKKNLKKEIEHWASRRHLTIQRRQQQARSFIEDLGNGVQLEMVLIPEGSFVMGSPKDEPKRLITESPQHTVTLKSFFLGKYSVTQAQWKAVASLPQVNRKLDPNPSTFQGENRPVEGVSWYDVLEFCSRLSQKTGRQYRPPSEAEWEYACRAATTTPFHFGETITPELANYDGNYTYGAGAKGIYRQETTPVGSFGVANAFGLYDMHGNVWEWCADQRHENYEGAPTDGRAWLDDNDNQRRVLRGGSWFNLPWFCRSAYRYGIDAGNRYNAVGFRVVCAAARTL